VTARNDSLYTVSEIHLPNMQLAIIENKIIIENKFIVVLRVDPSPTYSYFGFTRGKPFSDAKRATGA